MSQVDLVIKGGKLVNPDGIVEAALAVHQGCIAAIGDASNMPSARQEIDVDNQYVFPGIIDPHVHLQTFANPFDVNVKTESKSAAIGGCTTMIPMLLNREDATLSFLDYFPWCEEAVRKYASIDVAFSAVIGTDQQIAELPRMAHELGICSYKFNMAYTQDEAAVFGIRAVDDGQILEGMRVIRDIGPPAMLMVHAENMSIIHNLKAKYMAAGRNDLKAWTDARPDVAEEEATRRAIFYAKETGCRLYIVHMTIGRRGVEWVRQAHAEGVDMIAETCPHYLVLTKYDHDRVGHLGKVNPPLRDQESQDKLWEGLRDGTVACVGSDHSTIVPKADKLQRDLWTAVPGFPGMGMMLPIMLSEGYHKGRISLQRLAAVLSYNNAVAYGLYPKKGAIRVGSDADFAVVDLNQKRVVTPELMQSFADWGLYDGWELTGWPTMTIVRGQVVMRDGQFVGQEGYGQYLPRYPTKGKQLGPES
jgi:dihydropyrimidinase